MIKDRKRAARCGSYLLAFSIVLLSSGLVSNVVYADDRVGLEVQVELPEIGFLTVGDWVPVTIIITNNSNETRYFIVKAWFSTSRFVDPIEADSYEARVMIPPFATRTVDHTFLASIPELWWVVVDAHGYQNPNYIGQAIGQDHQNSYYVHPSSDRDIKIIADSTALTAEAMQRIPITTWLLVIAAIASAAGAVGFGYYQATIHRKNLKLNAMKQVFDLLSADPYVGYRRTLYHEYCNLKKQGKSIIFNRTDTIYEYADAVEGAFDKAAVLVFSDLVDYEEFFILYHDKVLRFWVAAQEDIAFKRKRNRFVGEHFEKLVNEYKQRVKELPEVDCSEFKGDFEVAEYEKQERAKRAANQKIKLEEEIASSVASVNLPKDDKTDGKFTT